MKQGNVKVIAGKGIVVSSIILVLSLLLSGCGVAGNSKPAAKADNTTIDPQTVMAAASAAASDFKSYRLSVTVRHTANGGDSQGSIEGEFSAPDCYHYKENLTGGQGQEFIVIGDKQYVYNADVSPLTITGSIRGLFSIVSPETTFEIMDGLTGVQQMPDETVEGVSCLHYQGTEDIEKQIAEEKRSIQEANAKAGTQMSDEDLDRMFEGMQVIKVEVELWIGKEDYLIRQLVQKTQIPGENQETVSSTINYSYFDFNQPVDIEPPVDANGDLLPGWNLAGSISPDSKQPVFTSYITSGIGAQPGYDDPAHQQISYHIAITNQSSETVENVRVMLSSMATNDEQKPLVIEGQPETAGHVEFAPGDSETYNIAWNYDGSRNTKEEIIDLVEQTTITVEFTTQDGRDLTQSLLPQNAPVPPAPTPGATG